MSRSPIKQAKGQYLRLEMNADTDRWADIIVWFNNANKSIYEPLTDGKQMPGFEDIKLASLSSDGVPLLINKQPLPGNERRVIGLSVSATDNGNYHFNLRQVVGLPQLYDVWLLDAFKKDSTNLRSAITYDFKIDTLNPATSGDSRFSLVIKQNPAYAYRLIDFSANKVAQAARQVQVVWKTQNEENYTNFTVERSTDGGNTFTVLDGVTASAQGIYSYNDNTPVIGQNFYRLKQVDINNVTTYSKTVLIRYDNLADQVNGAKLNIFPNPANGEISLAILPVTNDPAVYKVTFSSTIGATIKEFTLSQTTWQGNVSDLLPGTYLVRVLDIKPKAW